MAIAFQGSVWKITDECFIAGGCRPWRREHDLRNVDALLVDSDDSAPLNHPAKGLLDDPSAGRNLEDLLPIAAADDLYDEIQIADLVHEFEMVIGAIVKEMFDPRLAPVDAERRAYYRNLTRVHAQPRWKKCRCIYGRNCEFLWKPDDDRRDFLHMRTDGPRSRDRHLN